jgi:hypothetical protein
MATKRAYHGRRRCVIDDDLPSYRDESGCHDDAKWSNHCYAQHHAIEDADQGDWLSRSQEQNRMTILSMGQ